MSTVFYKLRKRFRGQLRWAGRSDQLIHRPSLRAASSWVRDGSKDGHLTVSLGKLLNRNAYALLLEFQLNSEMLLV